MDKIIEKLASVLSPEDLNEVKAAFESAVDERVQAKLDEETKNLAMKADEFCQKKIKEAVEKKTAELEDLANKYCEERCAKITENAQAQIDSRTAKLEEAAQQYIYEYFEEKYQERCGKDLEALEERLIEGLDSYLETHIAEQISPDLIRKTAITETYAPIIEGIQSLFENQYVALDTTGAKKLREAKAEAAEAKAALQEKVKDSMRLAEQVETYKKKAIVAEATAGLTESQKARVQKMFENKSLSQTRDEIEDYVQVISEQTIRMRNDKKSLFEKAKPVSQSLKVEDSTADILAEKKNPTEEITATDAFLLRSAAYMPE